MKRQLEISKYFNDKYYNKSKNYDAILYKINREENIKKPIFFRIAATVIISILTTTSVVFASMKIYNEYIKNKGQIDTDELYISSDGTWTWDFAEDMIHDEKSGMYYKIITDFEEYNKYKEKNSELPEMTEIDFNNNFCIIIGRPRMQYPHERDLEILDISADSTNTYVTIKQKNNPNYDKTSLTLYAIAEKTLLKNNIELNIEIPDIKVNELESIENLPNDYSIESALNDGCFVQEDMIILSENKYLIDELIENAKNDKETAIRIYSKTLGDVYIIDIKYENGIYVFKFRTLNDETNTIIFSSKYIHKHYYAKDNTYSYTYNDDPNTDAGGLLVNVFLDE